MGKKFSQKVDVVIGKKKIPQLFALEKEIEEVFAGDQFSMDMDYWDFLLMTVKKKRAILTILSFFNNFEKPNNLPRPFIKETEVQSDEKVFVLDYQGKGDDSASVITQDHFLELLAIQREKNLTRIFEAKVKKVIAEKIDDEVRVTSLAAKVFEDVNLRISRGLKDITAFLSPEGETSGQDGPWTDDFRPRKPHFFNRVKLGYEWNRINQSRYTKDNPPPREVVGYKFNIFYPGLIDKTIIPTFKLTQMEDPAFAIITFIAGPPYSKISFQIVNRQWNMADRKNFKHLYHKHVLNLYFDFAKQRHLR